jgi:hypothetical protein
MAGGYSTGCARPLNDALPFALPETLAFTIEDLRVSLAAARQWHSQDRHPIHDNPGESPVTTETPKSGPKAQLDALLLKLHGVSARKINGLDAYFVSDRMFACISGNGVGLRLPAATATELHFSRDNISPFQPRGIPATREWIQIDRADAADYARDLELFQTSIDFVKAGGR